MIILASSLSGTRNAVGSKDNKQSFPFNTSAPPTTFLSTVTMATTRQPMRTVAAAYRDPCDPSYTITPAAVSNKVLSLPPPPSISVSRLPPSIQYPSQQQQFPLKGGAAVKSTAHVSSQSAATAVTVSTGSTNITW